MHNHNVNNDIGATEGSVNNVSMDYMFLNDNTGDGEQPNLVVVDHNHGRIFAYGVPKNGAWGESAWVPRRAARDLNNMVYGTTKITNKTRPGTINSSIARGNR